MRINRIVLFFSVISLLLLCLGSCGVSAANAAVNDKNFLDELTFLGDSTTAHMQQRSTLREDQIWAAKDRYLNLDSRITYAKVVAPDTGEEETIATLCARLKPRYLVITLGVDYGVYYYRNKPESFRLYYEKLLSAIQDSSPNTTLILQSIFPVGRSSTAITNEMIEKANGIIADLAAEKGLVFVDQTATLSDAEGYLRPEYCYSEDGIHLTAAAYEAILSHLASLESRIGGGT